MQVTIMCSLCGKNYCIILYSHAAAGHDPGPTVVHVYACTVAATTAAATYDEASFKNRREVEI